MQRTGSTTGPQVILLLFLGSFVWARQLTDNYDKVKLLYSYPAGYYKRLPSYSYDFGLGKRSFDDTSFEEQGAASSPLESTMDKDSSGILYPFGPGKRNRAYGFGLGKRLMENDWKLGAMPGGYRQERRSKIYSFGLGKRQSHDMLEDYDASPPSVERRANNQRQFAFGLGKRDLKQNSQAGNSE